MSEADESDEEWNEFADRFTVSGCEVLLDGVRFATAETPIAARFAAGALSYSIGHYRPLIEYADERRTGKPPAKP